MMMTKTSRTLIYDPDKDLECKYKTMIKTHRLIECEKLPCCNGILIVFSNAHTHAHTH